MNDTIKCIIWDLDDTIWYGTFDESPSECKIKPLIPEILKKTYECGIVNVLISKNDQEAVLEKLKGFKIYDYFTYTFINWKRKYFNVIELNHVSNIEYEDMILVDNSNFEIDEIRYYIPSINTLNASDYTKIYDYINVESLTDEDRNRNSVYKKLVERDLDEKKFVGTKSDFLQQCNVNVNVREANLNDLKRIKQLLYRTHKFNTTNCLLDESTIIDMIKSSDYNVLLCDAYDNYANYGTVGVAIIKVRDECRITTFAVSCKIEGRGIGRFFLSYIVNYIINYYNQEVYCDYSVNKKNHYMSVIFKNLNFVRLNDKTLIRNLKESITYDNWINFNSSYETKAKIANIIKTITGNSYNEADIDLIENGIVDSMTLIELITHIEEVFDIYMDFDDLSVENYKTLESICELVDSKIKIKQCKNMN